MLSYIYAQFEDRLSKADENVESSFQFQVFQFQTSSDLFTKAVEGMPEGMEDRMVNCVLLGFLKKMFMGWYHEKLEEDVNGMVPRGARSQMWYCKCMQTIYCAAASRTGQRECRI
jgi:hypothetical protein